MKTLFLILALFAPFYGKNKLVGKRMPEVSGITISGVKIDSAYFKNKVTFVTFMYIGCPPCMNEIKALTRLKKRADFQILVIAPHTPEQLREFNSDSKSKYSDIRKYFGAGKVEFDLMPECDKPKDTSGKIRPECDRVSRLFKVDGYPASFLIDRNRVVKNAYIGFADGVNDSLLVSVLQKDIDKL